MEPTVKKCRGCHEVKELSAFTLCKSGKYGVMGQCKSCKKLTRKAWLEAHPDYNRTYYAANQEILLQKKREKRKDPVEKEKNKKHTANRRARMGEEAYSAWRKKLKIKDRDKIQAYNKAYQARLPDAIILREFNESSKARLTLDDIPKDMIEARRLLFKIRRMANEKCNATTK